MANTYILRSNGSGTSTQKGTISVWIKSGEEPSGNNQTTLASWGNATNHGALLWNGSDKIDAFDYQGGYASQLQTNALLRDSSAWYHIVYSWDTTLSTANDRQKVYINGVEQTYSTRTNYSQNAATSWNANSYSVRVGALNSSSYFSGLMSHVHFIDGTQYAASTFGSTDSTTGEWTINTSPSVTYGNNGFFVLKDGNTITDQSGESNDFSLGGGTLTKTEDCPDNNFATLNPLLRQNGTKVAAPTKGNTTFTSNGGAAWGTLISTIGATTGKYYCEAKCATLGTYAMVGICDMSADAQNSNAAWYLGQTASSAQYGYNSTDGNIYTNDSNSSYGTSFTTGDIMGIAMDLDNNKLYFRKNNNAWENSGNPESGSTGTGAVSITADKTYGFGFSGYDATVFDCNFGNGYFGTTAVSSAGTNASGIGIFEYDVPTGYTALSTKGLNL